MQKNFFFLAPVEVVKVTSSNLEEVANWCGGKVAEVESRRVPGRMDKYVWVPTPKDSKISWAFPGMIVTKRVVVTMKDELKETWAVYRRDYFDKNYFNTPKEAADATWERQVVEKAKPKRPEVKVSINVGDVLAEAMEMVKEKTVEALKTTPANEIDVQEIIDNTKAELSQEKVDVVESETHDIKLVEMSLLAEEPNAANGTHPVEVVQEPTPEVGKVAKPKAPAKKAPAKKRVTQKGTGNTVEVPEEANA